MSEAEGEALLKEQTPEAPEGRFATEGEVDAKFFRSLKAYLVPPSQRLIVLIAALVLSGTLIVLGITGGRKENIFLGVLFAAVLLFEYFTIGDRLVKTSVKRMKELAHGEGGMAYATSFVEDGVHVANRTTGGEGTIAYGRLAQLVETDKCLVLFSQSRQYVPIFKSGLDEGEREELIEFLHAKCPDMKMNTRVRALP